MSETTPDSSVYQEQDQDAGPTNTAPPELRPDAVGGGTDARADSPDDVDADLADAGDPQP